jgi:hypothetical protein
MLALRLLVAKVLSIEAGLPSPNLTAKSISSGSVTPSSKGVEAALLEGLHSW